MKTHKEYDIYLNGLKPGRHQYQFKADDVFFESFGVEQEFRNSDLDVEVQLDKFSTFMELDFHLSGTLDLLCDISNEYFSYPVDEHMHLIVKFGHAYSEENEEIITIPDTENILNIAQYIYEMAVLSIPMKKVNPDLDSEALDILEKFAPKNLDDEADDEEDSAEDETETDPRWSALQKLKNKN